MFRTSRALLLLLSFLSLQLSLMSGGERCPMVATFGQSVPAMAGMDMAGMDMAGMAMPAAHTTDQTGTVAGLDEHPCDEGDGSSTTCDSMTVCAFAAVVVPSDTIASLHRPSVHAPILAVRMPPSDADGPDLPPPRHAS